MKKEEKSDEKERMLKVLSKIEEPIKKKVKINKRVKLKKGEKPKNRRIMNYRKPAKVTEKIFTSLLPEENLYKKETPILALDCEMVICEDNQRHLARLSIVNFNRHVIFDEYIKPTLKVKNYLFDITNIDPFKINHSQKFEFYKDKIFAILKNRILVGHTLEKDFEVMDFKPDFRFVRDISEFKLFMDGKFKSSLKNLSEKYLKIKIQGGTHSSVEDSRATLELYKLYKREIDLYAKDKVFKKKKLDKKLGIEFLNN